MTVVVAGALALAACDSWLSTPSRYNTVEVITSLQNGDSVPGVDLYLYTGQRPMGYGTTDAHGRFTFTRVPEGNYGVAIMRVPVGYGFVPTVAGERPSYVVDGLDVRNNTLPPVHLYVVKSGSAANLVHVPADAGSTEPAPQAPPPQR